MERDIKENEEVIEKADLIVQSKVRNKTQQELITEKAQVKAAKPIKEVWSTSLAQGGMGGAGTRSEFAQDFTAQGGATGATYTKTTTTTTTTTTKKGEAGAGNVYIVGSAPGKASGGAYSKTTTTTTTTKG
ncbi:unnamed protein product, partial [Strongylus vulgaris]